MSRLIILTTATPRHDLHAQGLFGAVDVLLTYTKNVKWFVNIDSPSMFTDQDVQDTLEHFNSFHSKQKNLGKNLGLNITYQRKAGHFGAAARRLYATASSNIRSSSDNVYMWLEDDWMLFNPMALGVKYNQFITNNDDILLATEQKYISGHPFFYRQDFFDLICSMYQQHNDNVDPELHLFECAMEMYNTIEPRYRHPSNKVVNAFCDIGRDWRDQRQIRKLEKYNSAEDTITWKKKRKKAVDLS